MSRPTISVCYIVRDEAMFLEASLKSVRGFATEIILVDTGSVDLTRSIAAPFVNRLENFKWSNDFSAARNYAASFATGDWILFVDGDEVLETRGAEKLYQGILENPDVVAFGVLQRNYTNDRSFPAYRTMASSDYGERSSLAATLSGFSDNLMMKFYRNHVGLEWEGVVHETIVGSCRRLSLKHLEIPLCILHHLGELKSEELRNQKKIYYLQLAVEKLKANSEHENPWFEVGIGLNNIGRFEEAEKAFDEAIKRRPDWYEAQLFRARALLQLERYAEAETLLKSLLCQSDFEIEARGQLSTALLYQNKLLECEEVLEKALTGSMVPLNVHINASTLYFERGDFKKAHIHMARAVEMNPGDEFLKEALSRIEGHLKIT